MRLWLLIRRIAWALNDALGAESPLSLASEVD